MVKKNNLKSLLLLTPLFLTTLFAFTNCGSQNGSETQSSVAPSSASRTTEPPTSPPTPTNTDFKAGDTISKAELQKVSTNLTNIYDDYAAESTKPKAMAITWDGLETVGLYGFSQDASGLNSHMITLCNARFHKLCVILATGNKFTIGYQDLQNMKRSGGSIGTATSVVKGQSIELSSFPILRGHQTISDYLANTGIKAMALSWSGGLVWQASASTTLTQAEMSRMTLDSCQLATQKKCVLLAEGNTYALDWRSDKMAWTLPAAGQVLDLGNIPLVGNKYRLDASNSVYRSYIQEGGHGAIYLVQGGGASLWVSKEAGTTVEKAKTEALKTCQATYPTKTCHLFAVDSFIVWDIAEKN